MSTLTNMEKAKLEILFEMEGGYVLDFSNRTIEEFFAEKLGVEFYSEKYYCYGGSKGKILRGFWHVEDDALVGKSIRAMIDKIEEDDEIYDATKDYRSGGGEEDKEAKQKKKKLIAECRSIEIRLLSGHVNLGDQKQFDAAHLAELIRRMKQSINDDPALAIGTAKELVESCCKTILSERGKPIAGAADMSSLTKAALKELNLVPEGVSENRRGSDIIKRILQNLGTIGNGLAELRNLYGTGHGKDAKSGGLTPRHAKLAAGAASTLAIFLFETHEKTKNEEKS